MKANKNFRMDDEAVSPVIGVILMVAITVVLAAVVFVLVSDLGDTGAAAPSMSFSKDEGADRLSLVSADSGLDWIDFEIKADATGVDYARNTEATDAAGTALTTDFTALATGDVDSGDFLDFCDVTTANAISDLAVQIRHIESNTLVYETTFTTVSNCSDAA